MISWPASGACFKPMPILCVYAPSNSNPPVSVRKKRRHYGAGKLPPLALGRNFPGRPIGIISSCLPRLIAGHFRREKHIEGEARWREET
jgi:hypothetical protein